LGAIKPKGLNSIYILYMTVLITEMNVIVKKVLK